MSDPVKSAQIEDVLSSIRRLVTEEDRKPPRAAPAPPRASANKLVLTPALRVDEDARMNTGETGEAPAPFQLRPEFEHAEHSDEIKFRHRALRSFGKSAAGDAPVAGASGDRAKLADPPWADPNATLHEAAAQAGDDGAFDESADEAGLDSENIDGAVEEDRDDQSQDMRNEDIHSEDIGEAAPAEIETGDAADNTADVGMERADADADTEEAVTEKPAASLSQKIHALEQAIAKTQDQWEPDGEAGDDYAGTPVKTIMWQDHDAPVEDHDTRVEDHDTRVEDQDARVEGQDTHAPQESEDTDTGAEAEATPEPAPLAADESLIDEETLRELVADIVRQELQGALGERITRNVRKLVRREIHRALTTQELE